MSIKLFDLPRSDLFFTDEQGRESTQRAILYYESFLPKGVPYTMAKAIADFLGGACSGISASHQPSAQEMKALVEQFPSKKFTVIDLREECHFFLDGAAISLTNKDNNPNLGKTLSQINQEESIISQTLRKQSVIIHKLVKEKRKSSNGEREKIITFVPQAPILSNDVETEEALVKNLQGAYVRMPLTDHGFPSADQIDELISIYENQQKENSWIHVHCAAGRGRSSSVFTIFAILKWARALPLDEIFSRLELRGNVQLVKPTKKGQPVYQRSDFSFWERFYQFARNRSNGVKLPSWQA